MYKIIWTRGVSVEVATGNPRRTCRFARRTANARGMQKKNGGFKPTRSLLRSPATTDSDLWNLHSREIITCGDCHRMGLALAPGKLFDPQLAYLAFVQPYKKVRLYLTMGISRRSLRAIHRPPRLEENSDKLPFLPTYLEGKVRMARNFLKKITCLPLNGTLFKGSHGAIDTKMYQETLLRRVVASYESLASLNPVQRKGQANANIIDLEEEEESTE
ncbi:hypothetical protein C8F04DRAFT_1183953 [Mycena alexandri]|uniref:Uncharacterized protein n=1 Tax=Mycena alexandri TaxID=1745969 RepID=A0AAD6STH3_9AGAR|nr:hypothetical protein C8F04DRAFT_1183953 [Mycena alexandri]